MISRVATLLLLTFAMTTITGCGKGMRDSLLLTGLRDKPDETKVQVNEVLVIPGDDRVVAPNTQTVASVKRSDTYAVNTILFGEDVAEDEVARQLQVNRANEYTPAEAQLLQHAYGVSANTSSQITEEKRPWWKISVPKIFGKN